jgi:hypothetical protein
MAGGEGLQEELRALQAGLQEIRLTQRQHGQGLIKVGRRGGAYSRRQVGSLSGRLDGLERRQEEVVRLLLSLRLPRGWSHCVQVRAGRDQLRDGP